MPDVTFAESWRAVLVHGGRLVGEVLEENPEAELVVRLHDTGVPVGALGTAEPDAVFEMPALRAVPGDVTMDDLGGGEVLSRRDAELPRGGYVALFLFESWSVGISEGAVHVVQGRVDDPGELFTIRKTAQRRALPGPPFPGGISVSCQTCQCRTTVPARISRRCPCGNPPPDHQLVYGP